MAELDKQIAAKKTELGLAISGEDRIRINKELEAYNPEIASRPQVIAANKIDCIFDEEESPVQRLKDEFEPKGIRVFPISAVSGQGVKELLYYVKEMLANTKQERIVFEQEFFPEDILLKENLPYTVERSEEDSSIFIVEGPKIEKMLGYTNLGIKLLIIYVIITVIRNYVEPKIVGTQLGLHPIITLVTMFIGLRLFGFWGLFGLPVGISFLWKHKQGTI